MSQRIGVFLAGALGDVATTTIVGALAIARGLAPETGLTTALDDFSGCGLAPLDALVFGGCDVREGSLLAAAHELEASHILPTGLADRLAGPLAEVSARIASGVLLGASETVHAMAAPSAARKLAPRAAIQVMRGAIRKFAEEARADRVVVVHVASVEPRNAEAETLADEGALDRFLDTSGEKCPASLVYALAAQDAGAGYVNFTPSCGASSPVMRARAEGLSLVHAGRDGKTGETLLKSVLAPMLGARNFRVLSWVGFNILGNRDGAVLHDPSAREAKLRSKGSVVRSILGDRLGTEHVGIEYVPSIGDWKTAWDHIHCEGFLGAPLTLQLTWKASDSALAAPLVIDLVRLIDRAKQVGRKGLVPELAAYFKDPLGCAEARFPKQLDLLAGLAAEMRAKESPSRSTQPA